MYCDRIFGIMKSQLTSDGKDMQVAASEGFVNCLRKHKNLRIEIQLDIFHLSLVILGQWNVEVIDEWIKIFELVVDQLDWTFMKDKLAELINHLSQSSQPKQSRYAAARIMVALAKVHKLINPAQRQVHGGHYFRSSYTSLSGLREGCPHSPSIGGHLADLRCSSR